MHKIDLKLMNNFNQFKTTRSNRLKAFLAPILSWAGIIGAGSLTGISVATFTAVATIVQTVVSFALTIWSYCTSSGGKSGNQGGIPNLLDSNGQLVNTRQSSDPLRVLYGIVKTGGTWVFSRASASNNTLLNTVISWGEGELSGLGTAIDSSVSFDGTGLNDLETSGEYVYSACTCDSTCYSHTACTCNMACDGVYA